MRRHISQFPYRSKNQPVVPFWPSRGLTVSLASCVGRGSEPTENALLPHYKQALADVMNDPSHTRADMERWIAKKRDRFNAAQARSYRWNERGSRSSIGKACVTPLGLNKTIRVSGVANSAIFCRQPPQGVQSSMSWCPPAITIV